MAITYTNDYATISTTEYGLASDSTSIVYQTTDGVFQFFIDFINMTITEQYRVRLYEKYDSGSTARLIEEWILTGAQSKPMFVTPAFTLGEGWEITVTKLAGTDRSILWSIRKIA
jgi:hypothetical protein